MGVDAEFLLPTFFVIGASKSGTTSLHWYLDAHPEIEMTAQKERHYMIAPHLPAYRSQFTQGLAIRGDCSPGYAVYPNNPGVASNIAAHVPSARLVYCVRDPIERCLAQYAQHVVTGVESRQISEAIVPDDPRCEYVNASRYATNLEAYLAHFDLERIMVIDQAELRERREQTLAILFRHLGVDPGFSSPAFAVEHNVRGVDNVRLPRLVRGARASWLNQATKRLLPRSVRARLVGRIGRVLGQDVRPRPDSTLTQRLEEVLGEEAARFRQLTSRSFADWSV